jgi:hypothetical protein
MDKDTTLRVLTAALSRRTGGSLATCRATLVECDMDFELARRIIGYKRLRSPFVRRHMIEAERRQRA